MAEALRLEKEPTKPVTRGAKQNVERSTNESAYAHATPSTKKKGKESRTTFMRKFEAVRSYFDRKGKKNARLNGTHFTFQRKTFADVHKQRPLSKSKNLEDTKFRCKCCHFFNGADGMRYETGNKKCTYVCEPRKRSSTKDAGACNGMLYCDSCFFICHNEEAYKKNIPNVQEWLNTHGSNSCGVMQSTRRQLNSSFRNAA